MIGRKESLAASILLAILSAAAPGSASAAAESQALVSEIRSLRAERDALLEHIEALESRAKQAKAAVPRDADGCRDPSLWLNAGDKHQDASSGHQPARSQTDEVQFSKRVFVHYSAQDPGGEQLARAVAQRLSESGFTVPELRRVAVDIERPSVRFFFEDDRRASLAVKKVVAPLTSGVATREALRVIDLRHYAPKPRADTLELWVTAAAP